MLFSMAHSVYSYVIRRVESTLWCNGVMEDKWWFRTAYQKKGRVRTCECVKLDNGLRLVEKPVIDHARVVAEKKLGDGDYNLDCEGRQQSSWQVTKVVATVNGVCQYSELFTGVVSTTYLVEWADKAGNVEPPAHPCFVYL